MAQRKQTIKHSRKNFCDTFTSKEYNRWFHSLRYKVFADYIKDPWKHKIHENVRAQQKKWHFIDNSLLVESNMLALNDVRPDQANGFGFEYFGLDSKYLEIFILVLKEHSLEKRKLLDSSGHW
ncbi:hypothetical protein HF325_005214 [Metschnikowia pulcherrima]|uniref:Uncharacterized protein n=1 Tax=Metschnikowia pulcherrima TaxID=27326 RepID=A0A8H7LAC3_9ASCO|nr:hypothetical protein HF325_005214 [Metschnikowia pulcherrima]